VRAAAVGALATLGGETQTDLVRPYLDDANPRIAATAAAVLAGSSKDEDRELAERTLTRLSGASDDRNASRREVAIALRQIRDPRTSLLLVPLLNDANAAVATEAMRTVRARPGRLPVRAGAGVAAAPSRPGRPRARRPRRLRRGSRAGAGALPPGSRRGHLGAAARAVDAVAHSCQASMDV
jgi:HEAT repeat protein